MFIGELGGQVGLKPTTVRYYESAGLLSLPPRTNAGYRRYGATDLARLRFIGKAKAVGLSLAEIREILTVQQAGTAPCAFTLGLVERRLAAVEAQLSALAAVRDELMAVRGELRRALSATVDEASGTTEIEAGAPSRQLPLGACGCVVIERHEPQARDRGPTRLAPRPMPAPAARDRPHAP